jgi:LysR family transcriptional regulator, carnitine catabolism transcriptional activator
MDSRKLAHFVAVAEHGGFTAAAKATFVSQPALSLAVKDLEAELGAQLFARIGHRVLLTSAGSALLGPAHQVLRDIETGRAAVEAVNGLLSGSLSLASLPTLAADPMARLVGLFRRQHEGVRVDLAAPEDSDDLFGLIESGACELGLTDAADVPSSLAANSLVSQELVFILPPGSPETAGDSLDALDRGEIPLVAAPVGTSTRRLLDQQLGSGGRPPRLAVISAQRDAILPLVVAGAGAALVPDTMARIAEKLGAVVARATPPVVRDLVLVHRSGALSPAASRFLELALEGRAPDGWSS